jgi:hypothetical protein
VLYTRGANGDWGSDLVVPISGGGYRGFTQRLHSCVGPRQSDIAKKDRKNQHACLPGAGLGLAPPPKKLKSGAGAGAGAGALAGGAAAGAFDAGAAGPAEKRGGEAWWDRGS